MGGEKLLLFRQVRSGSLARPYPCLTSLLSNTSFILKPDVHVLKVNPFGDDVLHKTYIQKLKHDLVWFDRNNSCITYMNGTYSPDHNKAAVLTLCQYPRHTRISGRNFQEMLIEVNMFWLWWIGRHGTQPVNSKYLPTSDVMASPLRSLHSILKKVLACFEKSTFTQSGLQFNGQYY